MSMLEARGYWRQDLVLQRVEKVLEDALELFWYVKVVVGGEVLRRFVLCLHFRRNLLT